MKQQTPRPVAQQSTSLVKKDERVATVRTALEAIKGQLALALPKHITADRLLRVVMTQVQRTPALLECERTSLYAAVMTAAQLGLEPDGVLGHGYLVPFKSRGVQKVQFIPGYKGLIALARNSGEVSSIQAQPVYEPGKFANYIAPPQRGVKGQPVNFEYVRTEL